MWATYSSQLKDPHLRGPFLYTSSGFVNVFAMAGSGFIVARLVLPEEIGTWYSVIVLLPYLTLLSLGLPQAAGRQFAFLSGAGEQKKAQELANTALSYTFLWSVVSMSIAVIVMFFVWSKGSDLQTRLAFVLFIIVAGSNPFKQYLHNLYRSGSEFGTLGAIQYVESVFNIVSIALVYFGGWVGLFIRYASIAFLSATLRFFLCPIPLRLHFSWPLFRQLFKMGLPRLIITIVAGLFLAADNTLIVTGLGKEAMGFYVLAIMAERAVGAIPLSLRQIVQVQMTVRYGQTKVINTLKRITFLPVLINAVVLLVPTILAIILIKPFVNAFLPNYIPGIDAARLAIVAGYFSALGISGGLFGAVDRLSGYMFLMLGSLGLYYLLGLLGLRMYGTIESVAAAKVLATAFLVLGINLMAFYYLNKKGLGEKKSSNIV